MFRIPDKTKNFTIDNESMSRGNIYETFNILFDADKGKVKLNTPVLKWKSTADNSDFVKPTSIIVSDKNGGGGGDAYILTTKSSGFGGVWSTTNWGKLTGANAPSIARDAFADMCLWNGYLHVSDSDGIHYVLASASSGAWTLINTDANWKGHFIIFPFIQTNRLYLVSQSHIFSVDNTYTIATSGSNTQTNITNLTCARAASKRIWYATQATNGYGDCKVYEWDGVNPNPLNIFTIPVAKIQTIVILNDQPIAIDQRGRFWFYDGYNFTLKDGIRIPAREDDYNPQTVYIHRNGSFADKGKAYVLVGSGTSTKNTAERALAGIWCYDPQIGLYNFASPDNSSHITTPYALAKGLYDNTIIAGYSAGELDVTSIDKISTTEQSSPGSTRTGFITTQFLESGNITDEIKSIIVKYRKMIDTTAQIEIKYRTWKNVECNTTITWTSANTFTTSTNALNGVSGLYCTPVEIGDEVMVQNGANAGLIAQVLNRVDGGGTSTITIDRNATLTSGSSYAMFSNYVLLKTITNDGAIFKKALLNKSSTMIQVKIVMSWKGYNDELQEIIVPTGIHEAII
jgi:hypothetical protein